LTHDGEKFLTAGEKKKAGEDKTMSTLESPKKKRGDDEIQGEL